MLYIIILIQCLFFVLIFSSNDLYRRILYHLNTYEYTLTSHNDDNCIDGWTESLKGLNIKCDICFFGHSMIRNHDFSKDFPNSKVVQLGYAGQDINGMLKRVEQIRYVNPQIVVIWAGTNSLGYPKKKFEEKYSDLLFKIKNSCPNSKILAINILPQSDGKYGSDTSNSVIIERNAFIYKVCRKFHVTLVDAYDLYKDNNGKLDQNLQIRGDGVHPSNYNPLIKALKNILQI